MRPNRWLGAALGLAWSCLAMAAPPPESDALRQRVGSGDPVAGKAKSEAELCQGCHGEDGRSTVVGVPNLAGQYAAYLIKQLREFRAQERRHRIMTAMAEGLSEADATDIAAFFASQTGAKNEAVVADAVKDLFLYGDVDRAIEACAGCHEPDGRGRLSRGIAYPALAGQQPGYLRVQLLNWKAGARANSPDGVMNRIAAQLSEDEIVALADYLSRL